jgi:hypothetical protein
MHPDITTCSVFNLDCIRCYQLRHQHRAQYSQLQQQIQGIELHPAQVLALADQQQLSIDSAVNLLRVNDMTRLLDRSAEGPSALSSSSRSTVFLALRNHARQHEKTAQLRATAQPHHGVPPLQQLRALAGQLPSALQSLQLDWAQQLLTRMEAVSAPMTRGADHKPATRVLRTARSQYQSEVSRRHAGAAVGEAEKNWLSDAAMHRAPTAAEQSAVQRLLHHYQVPEHYVASASVAFWQGLREEAKTQLDLFMLEGQVPADVLSGTTTRQAFIERISASAGFARYLQGDALSFNRIANMHLYPQINFDRLALEASNGGTLRLPQLKALEREPDGAMRSAIVRLACKNFLINLRAYWSGFGSKPERPAFYDFAAYLSTPGSHQLLRESWNHNAVATQPEVVAYQARVLDFIGAVEKRLDLDGSPPSAHLQALQEAQTQVQQQLRIIDKRGLNFVPVDNERQLDVQARVLLNTLLNRINHAIASQ